MLGSFLILLVAHWVGDFVLQTHWQATNKSKNNLALLQHVASYTLLLGAVAFAILPGLWLPLGFTLGNGVLHFCTDYITSRQTAKLYAKQDWHNFFVVVGFDQLIHQLTLAATLAVCLS